MSTAVPPAVTSSGLALQQFRDPLTSPRTLAVAAAIVVVHIAALIGLSHLRNDPEKATIEPTTFTATIIPLTPAPTPPQPAPPKPQPEPPKPKVAPPPPKPREQPKNAITQKAEPVAPPQQAQVEPVQNAAPTPPAPPAPAPAPAPSGPIEGLAVKCDEPRVAYPTQSRRVGEEGTVTLRLVIDTRGVVSSANVVKSSGFPRLDQAARTAALAMRCAPPMQNGRAVEAAATKPFNFNLND
ncbi:energy transducer TonB [Pandoraea sputorum]|uniref:Energy transducer TonB n=1 Tax=Pandoraea sputorum TaxID=93222 RepID=A0A5E5BAK6_9BURK|nr:energy transducer TonB [Pandoraea sputorum]VVE76938.1 energy transducer TonB [Pandoraea sputorum]VVE82328.1 energy transducer TonB [Pandoraea sputorum]